MGEEELFLSDFKTMGDEEIRTVVYELLNHLKLKVVAKTFYDNPYREFTIETSTTEPAKPGSRHEATGE